MKLTSLLSLLLLMMTVSLNAQINTVTLSTRSDSCKVSHLKKNLNTIISHTSKNYLYTPKSINIRSKIMRQPLIIIDGVTSNHGTLGLEPNDIRSINVRKDEGTIKLYGGQGSDGVIIITTKNKTTQSDNFKVSFLNENLNTRTSKNYLYTPKSINLRSNIMRQPLIIIDGVISNHGTLGLVPNNIKSISVRKDERTIKLYGGQGNDGVILITTKNKTVL